MDKYTLQAQSALDGFNHAYEGVSVTELTNLAILSIATPLNGEAELANQLSSQFKTAIPEMGRSLSSNDGLLTLLRLQSDQMFVLLDESKMADASLNDASTVMDKIGEAGYMTDQSDSWVMLRIEGPASRAALERICPIDLNAGVFNVGDIARTQMEHLGVILLRDSDNSFILMSPRSSAASFLHAVLISIENTAAA